MAAAAAEITDERLAHLGFARMRRTVEQRFGGHDHAAGAIAALHRLLFNEGSLQRMGLIFGSDPLQRGDLAALDAAHSGAAGPHRRASKNHSASAALRKTAAEFRAG